MSLAWCALQQMIVVCIDGEHCKLRLKLKLKVQRRWRTIDRGASEYSIPVRGEREERRRCMFDRRAEGERDGCESLGWKDDGKMGEVQGRGRGWQCGKTHVGRTRCLGAAESEEGKL